MELNMKIRTKGAARKAAKLNKVTTIKPAAEAKPAVTVKKAPETKRVTFTVQAKPGSNVFLAGSFNGWKPDEKKMADKEGKGTYTLVLALLPGTYEYKFVIDGTWCADPECHDWVQNEHGTLNSVLKVTL